MRFLTGLFIFVAFFIAAGSAAAQTSSPRDVVVDLYKKHDAQKGPFWQKKSRALVDKYFTKTLADLIWKDAQGPDDEVPTLDGDPLYNAQDVEIKAFKIGPAAIIGTGATVPVSFTNFGKRENLKFAMKKIGTTWKIDNIFYAKNENLLKWLQSPND